MQSDNGIPSEPQRNGSPPDVRPLVSGATDPGLPPIEPPSGQFILRLFLVPFLIVVGVVCLGLILGHFFGERKSGDRFLTGLDNPNPEVRWRAAADLAQELPRDEALATDPHFALELTVRLKKALAENETSERDHRERASKNRESGEADRVPKKLQTERELILYLISCLGAFQVPVGAPLLSELAVTTESDLDAESAFRRRARAVLALMVLGGNLKKYDKLPPEKQIIIRGKLKEEADGDGERSVWAQQTLAFLKKRQPGQPARGRGVGEALLRCARDEAPFLRELAAGALNFWDAPGAEDALVCLAFDQGLGRNPVARDEKEEYRREHPEEVRVRNEKQIAYNAALALVRRGSPKVKRLFELLREMLDEERQLAVWKSDEPNRKSAYQDEAHEVVVRTLQALDQFHRENPSVNLTPLRPAIDRLVDSSHPGVSSAAREFRKKL